MKRRRFAAIITSAIAAISGCTAADTRNFIRNQTDVDEGVNWRFFSAGFDRIEWKGTDLIVHFEADHTMDFFHLSHQYNRSDPEKQLYREEAPDFDGKVRIPFVQLREQSDRNFPTQEFALTAYKGDLGTVSIYEETIGSVTFRVPDSVWNAKIIRG